VVFESVKARAPEAAVAGEPVVELGERFGANAVQPTLGIVTHLDQPGIPQDPLRRPACVHWTGPDPVEWLERQKQEQGTRIVGVELADESVRLGDLPAARERTIMVLGHERDGIPPEAMELVDVAVEIPMIGSGASLNVAVAGSLVLYRLAGFL
jgi:hypothetical protein